MFSPSGAIRTDNFKLEKRFFVKYLSGFDQRTAQSHVAMPFIKC